MMIVCFSEQKHPQIERIRITPRLTMSTLSCKIQSCILIGFIRPGLHTVVTIAEHVYDDALKGF